MTDYDLLMFVVKEHPRYFTRLYHAIAPMAYNDVSALVDLYHDVEGPENEKIFEIIESKLSERFKPSPKAGEFIRLKLKKGWFK